MAIYLDGTAHLEGPPPPLTAGQPITLSCWCRLAAFESASLIAISDGSAAGSYYQLAVLDDGSVICVTRNTAWQPAYSTSAYSTNQWFHAAAVIRSDTQWFALLNGVPGAVATYPSTTPTGLDTLAIGKLVRSTPTSSITAEIAEVAVWNEELPTKSLSALAAGFKPIALSSHAASLLFYRELVRGDHQPAVGAGLSPSGGVAWTRSPPGFGPSGAGHFFPRKRAQCYAIDAKSYAHAGAQSGATNSHGVAAIGPTTAGEVC